MTPHEPDGTTKLRLTLEKHISEQRTGYGGKSTLYRHTNLNNTSIMWMLWAPALSKASQILKLDNHLHRQDQVNTSVIM